MNGVLASFGLVDVGNDRRDTRLDFFRQADPEVEAERLGDLVLEEACRATTPAARRTISPTVQPKVKP